MSTVAILLLSCADDRVATSKIIIISSFFIVKGSLFPFQCESQSAVEHRAIGGPQIMLASKYGPKGSCGA